MNIALWIVQIVLAAAFAAIGGMKVFAYEKFKTMSAKNDRPLSRELATFIGLCELAGAIGLILPMAVNVAPWLCPAAAAGLAVVMVLAVIYHLRRHEPAAVPAVLLLLALFVAIGRVKHWA